MPFCWCDDTFSRRFHISNRDSLSTFFADPSDAASDSPEHTDKDLPRHIATLKAKRDAKDRSYWFDHIYWKSPKTLFEDICTMGNCLAGGPGSAMIIEGPDGNEKDFHERYIEDRVLGEGEFGVVRLVHDMKEKDESKNTMACKVLRKGVVFKGACGRRISSTSLWYHCITFI